VTRLPIRLRVTLAFAGVMAIVLLAVGLFLYLRLEAQLNESIDNGLRSRATEVSALARDAGGRLSSSRSNPLIEEDESFAQILTEQGRIVDSTPQLGGGAVLDTAELVQAAQGATFLERAELAPLEGPVRVLAAPVELGDRTTIAVVGSSLGDRDEALSGLATQLAVGGPIALLLASLAGYAMAGLALRPVEVMRRRAAEISASEAGARLPVPETRDELRRLGMTLNAMLDRLEGALERERRFVDDASHELRTPLALHRIELELALAHANDETELRAAIASAADEIDRLIALAEQLLVVARSEDGELAIDPKPFAIEDALSAIAVRFAARAARSERSVADQAPAGVRPLEADRQRVEQALTNLVENALRHGEGAVRIEARPNGHVVELHVTDEGPGIPEDFIDRAFERFSRADVARQRGGTGLGLAVVDSIARAHGGSAHARNRPEGGADVWIALPFTAISSVRRKTADSDLRENDAGGGTT
jgi:two-component system OmpR family sensor kinase